MLCQSLQLKENLYFSSATAFLTQDANIPGGTLIPYVHDLKACWRSCVYSFNCKGFDFDHHYGACWLHTDDTICETCEAKAHNSNYRLVHCATTTVDPTATTTAVGTDMVPTTGFETTTGTGTGTDNTVVKIASKNSPNSAFRA